MPYKNEHAARVRNPSDFIENSFRSKTLKDGIRMIMGKLKGQNTMSIQAYRFPKGKFNAESVKKWLKEHEIKYISFEKAIEEKMTDMDLGDARFFSDMKELFNGEYSEIEKIEILNTFPNSHKINFTKEDLDEIVSMYEEFGDTDAPNVKISHSDQQLLMRELFSIKDVPYAEELPNLGYLRNFRREGESIYADAFNIPSVLKDSIFGGKLFKTISPEIIRNYKGTGRKYIKAISLTNNPSLKHISDVHMSEALGYGGNFSIEGDITMDLDQTKDQVVSEDVQLSDKTVNSLFEKFADFFSRKKKEEITEPTPVVTEPFKDAPQMVSLSEMQSMKDAFMKEVNELKLKLVEKEKEQTNFSDQIKKIHQDARTTEAETIHKKALLDGIPKIVADFFKPILMSEIGEQTILLSEEVDGEIVEAQKPLKNMVVDFFKIYPNKVNFTEVTRTDFSAPSDDKNKQINARVKELEGEGYSRHDALIKAGQEIL